MWEHLVDPLIKALIGSLHLLLEVAQKNLASPVCHIFNTFFP